MVTHCRSKDLGSAALRLENNFVDIIINVSCFIYNFNFTDALILNTPGIFQACSCQTPLRGHFYTSQKRNCIHPVKKSWGERITCSEKGPQPLKISQMFVVFVVWFLCCFYKVCYIYITHHHSKQLTFIIRFHILYLLFLDTKRNSCLWPPFFPQLSPFLLVEEIHSLGHSHFIPNHWSQCFISFAESNLVVLWDNYSIIFWQWIF